MDVLLIGSRLWLWAGMVRGLKQVVPIATLVRLGRATRLDRATPRRQRAAHVERRVEAYLGRKGRFPFRPPSNCLERSLGAYRLLCGSGARPELVVGVRRSADRGVEGHVWVTVGGRALAETSEDLASFTPIVTFDADGRQRTDQLPTSNFQLPNAKLFKFE